MFAGMALSVRLLVYVGLSLFIINGPYIYMVVCVVYAYNLTNRHPIRALGNFHYQLIFAFAQPVSSYLKMNNSKDHISIPFMHRNLYEISTSQKKKD